jgi:hypothetical protein
MKVFSTNQAHNVPHESLSPTNSNPFLQLAAIVNGTLRLNTADAI